MWYLISSKFFSHVKASHYTTCNSWNLLENKRRAFHAKEFPHVKNSPPLLHSPSSYPSHSRSSLPLCNVVYWIYKLNLLPSFLGSFGALAEEEGDQPHPFKCTPPPFGYNLRFFNSNVWSLVFFYFYYWTQSIQAHVSFSRGGFPDWASCFLTCGPTLKYVW